MEPAARIEAMRTIEALLEREGLVDALAELRRTVRIAESVEAHAQNLREVTRSLLENEKTYRLVFSHELDPMSLFDPETGSFLDVNDAWVRLYGYSREEALAMRVTEVSAEPASTAKAIEQLPSGAATRIDLRWHKAKDGTVFPVELSAGKLMLGERPVMYAVMRDVTQRQRAELALARSEASHRALIESMPDAVLVHRLGRIVFLNPAAQRLLGYEGDADILGKSALDIVHPDDREIVASRMREVITHGTVLPVLEERVVRKDGSTIVAEVAAYHTRFDGEPAVIAIARDVTARKLLEGQVVMADRLASIGRLAASVGHELNNPLTYVLGNVTLIERELSRAEGLAPAVVERITTHLTMVKEGAVRMRDIVNDLKTLARGETDPRMPIDMQHLLDVCANMAEHEIRPRARLIKEYAARVTVNGTEARLGQVFLNLLVNAAQAIPEGDPDANEVRIVLASLDDERVLVEIHDTGAGIRPEDRGRIFEPFFTTKQGAGTGLGLAVSHTIVTSAGGTIEATPRVGGGTVFRVVLPSAQ